MCWIKPITNILLCLLCVVVIKGSSFDQVETNSKWLGTNFKRVGISEGHSASIKRARDVERSTNMKDLKSPHVGIKSKFHNDEFSVNHIVNHIRPHTKTEGRSDRFKSSGRNKLFSKTRKLINPEIQQPREHLTSKNGAKRASLWSGYILNRQASK
jgi:hypothetical protein